LRSNLAPTSPAPCHPPPPLASAQDEHHATRCTTPARRSRPARIFAEIENPKSPVLSAGR
jgi:hypothetical protein